MKSYETIQGIKMAVIPAGSFVMGNDYKQDPAIPDHINVYFADEQPVHEETLPAFQLGATQVTQEEYAAMVDANYSAFKGADLPVTNLGPHEIRVFCNKLSEVAGLEPCYGEGGNPRQHANADVSKNGFRMPTEAEWEYACRAGSTTMFYTGNTEPDLDRAGWYRANSDGKTHPVAQKEPNAWGLYDMHGNVFEFCDDDWNPAMSYGRYMPKGADPDFHYYHSMNVARGGGWFSDASLCRSATRGAFCSWNDINQCYYVGFRLARTIG